MGECRMQMEQLPEAVESLLFALNIRPRHMRGWESLIRCLFTAEMFDEALQQAQTAWEMTKGKPIFLYYQAAILMASRRRKQGLLMLEDALQAAPKLLKKFMELYPASLQEQSVVDLIARYKKKRG
jgi:tetratricopeptide (TPR) repeat protein